MVEVVFSLAEDLPGFFRVEAELFDGFGHDFAFDFSAEGELVECGEDDVFGVHFEEAAKVGAALAAAEAIGAKGSEAMLAREVGGNLFWDDLHVVAGGDDGAFFFVEKLGDVGDAGVFCRVETVPAQGLLAVVAEGFVAGGAPDVGADAVAFSEDFLGFEGTVENGAAAKELGVKFFAFGPGFEFVEAANNALGDFIDVAFWHAGVGVVFVANGDVVENVLTVLIHAADAVLEDDGDFVGKGGVVGHDVGNGGGHKVAVAVFVLEAFAVEGGAAGGGTNEEAFAAEVACGPDEIAHTLEAKHGVVGVEGDHGHAVDAVAGARGDEGGHRAGFVDAFLEDLSVGGFFVEHEALVFVDGFVGLAFGGVDAVFADEAFHAEGAGFVGDDGDDVFADGFVGEETGEDAHVGHGGGNLTAFGSRFEELLEFFEVGRGKVRPVAVAVR